MKNLNMRYVSIVVLLGSLSFITACSKGSNFNLDSLVTSDPSTGTPDGGTTDPGSGGGGNGGGGGSTTPTLTVYERKVAVGYEKTFSILSGTGRAAGSNVDSANGVDGQLGIGITGSTTRSSPTALDDVSTSYLSITAGEITSCGITSAKKVKCWGAFNGDNGSNQSSSPVSIYDTSSYVDVVSGSYHSCGVTESGVAKCWGDGWTGKLGNADGTGTSQAAPVVADSGTSYKRISAGRNHSCGITSNDKIKCWGDNGSGQIGVGNTTSPQLTPSLVDSSTSYKEISSGEDSNCAITTAGVLKCWGSNSSGQLGDNTTTQRTSPVVIDSGTTYAKISVGATYNLHTCGITTAGVLKCWGENSEGQLGTGNTTASQVPVVINSGTTYREVSVNGPNTCAITTAGVLKCWGKNNYGQIGNGNTTLQNSPTTIGSGF